MRKIFLFFIGLMLGFGVFAGTEGLPDAPNPPRLVVDNVGLLDEGYKAALENKLEQFTDSTSNQILVLIVDDLLGMDPAEYALEIGRKWGVGTQKFNNGIVFLIKPTGGKGERKTYIAVGTGLEGAIPDAAAKMIIEREVIPRFKDRQFDKGIDNAVNVLISLAKKEYSFKTYQKKQEQGSMVGLVIALIITGLFVYIFYRNTKNGNRQTIGSQGVNNLGWFAAGMMMGSMGRRNSGSGWSDFSSGSGGFGGFGGGSFGGGGAGGSW